MKNQNVARCLLVLGLINTAVYAQKKQKKAETLNEVVVTATKFETNKKNIGKIVYTITKTDLENNQGKTLVDFLNDIPGIEINGNFSNRGQNLGYYIRGGRNRQVAVLIDGVNVNDPSSFNGDFDLRQIDINQIERVEVLKGAASTLYGSGAATGVINIILKKASKDTLSGIFTSTVGTNRAAEHTKFAADEWSANVNVNGTLDKFSYMLALNTNTSSGLSAAESNTNSPFKEDTFSRKNALLQLNYKVNSKLKLGLLTSLDDTSADFDGFEFNAQTLNFDPVDAPNNLNTYQQRIALNADYNYKKGQLKVRTFITDIDRKDTPSNDFFNGNVFGFDVFNNYTFNTKFSLLTGVTAQYQDMTQRTSFQTIENGVGKQWFYDPYVSFNYFSGKGFNLNLGTRLNIHNEYGSNWVFNINPSYNFTFNATTLKVFASHSSAFITPTLSEIFTKLPTVDDLLPEQDVTTEVGFEFAINKTVNFNVTYFYREETNGIAYDLDTFKTINDIGTFNAKGIEAEVSYKASNKLNILANYTYINRDKDLLLKIPQHKFFAKADYTITPQTFTSLSYRFVGKAEDFGEVFLPSYNLVDVFVNHSILDKKLTFYTGVTNVFNTNFQEIAGFTTRGRNLNLGFRYRF